MNMVSTTYMSIKFFFENNLSQNNRTHGRVIALETLHNNSYFNISGEMSQLKANLLNQTHFYFKHLTANIETKFKVSEKFQNEHFSLTYVWLTVLSIITFTMVIIMFCVTCNTNIQVNSMTTKIEFLNKLATSDSETKVLSNKNQNKSSKKSFVAREKDKVDVIDNQSGGENIEMQHIAQVHTSPPPDLDAIVAEEEEEIAPDNSPATISAEMENFRTQFTSSDKKNKKKFSVFRGRKQKDGKIEIKGKTVKYDTEK